MQAETLSHLLITPPLWFATLLAAAFAMLVGGLRLVSLTGAVATFAVGFIVFGLGGGWFTIPLLTFFFTSSLLSRVGRLTKGRHTVAAKGATRDAGQVLANGGGACLLVLLFAAVVRSWPVHDSRALLILFLAALATVNADTWATELGALSPAPPRSLRNWKRVAPGTSGAISALGSLAALVGAVVIPLSALPFWHLNLVEFLIVAWAGFLGSFIDSFLGAGPQVVYRDPMTGELTERTLLEGRRTVPVRGLAWMNNDMVNFLASVGGVFCAWCLLRFGFFPFH